MKTLTCRNSNIELLRICLMLMIITYHVMLHGLGLRNVLSADSHITFGIAINSFVIIAVNTFIFISGYFGIRFKIKNIISLLTQAVFYSVVLYIIFSLINNTPILIRQLIQSFLPISTYTWWFISTYIGLYILSPIINKGVSEIEKSLFTKVLIGLFFLNCFSGFIFGTLSGSGYSIFNFIFIYILAQYLKRYNPKFKHPFLYLVISTVLLFTISSGAIAINNTFWGWKVFSYNNPILIFSATMLFYTFKNLPINSNQYINMLAKSTLGIYMIHDYRDLREIMSSYAKDIVNITDIQFGLKLLYLFLLVIAIYTCSFVIDLSRKSVTDRFINNLYIFMRLKYIRLFHEVKHK